ncbi:MAG: PmoA family protein [Bacteroidales bacterium]|nr:PmoA family protein [Bacteroidales bacterium]
MKKYPVMFQKLSLLALFCLVAISSYSQKIATLEVELTKATFGLDIPVSINLDDVTYVSDSVLNLLEVKGDKKTPVPFQIEQGDPRKLYWIVKTEAGSTGKQLFELVKGKAPQSPEVMAIVNDGALTIHKGDQNLLQYYFKTVYPPKGVDTAYKRSGFIHPLWSPHGQVLTRIQPPDHRHHYGIWNPWTHVAYEGDTVDFWNINSKQGTVRFANFVSVENGSVFSEFGALHEHVVFKNGGGEKVAMNELQSVRVYRPQENQDFFVVDFDIKLNTADESPVKLLEYRYAGFGWRTTEKWDNKNSMVLTSEGKTRKDADGSKARWCIVQGEIDTDYAGVVMMSYPTNYNFPEPLRIWPENQYNRGDMFANFCPTKDMDWLLKPRQNYSLKYRLLVFNGRVEKEKAESAWQYFAYPPKVTVKIEEH